MGGWVGGLCHDTGGEAVDCPIDSTRTTCHTCPAPSPFSPAAATMTEEVKQLISLSVKHPGRPHGWAHTHNHTCLAPSPFWPTAATMTEEVKQLISLSLKHPVRLAADPTAAAPQELTQEIVRLKGAQVRPHCTLCMLCCAALGAVLHWGLSKARCSAWRSVACRSMCALCGEEGNGAGLPLLTTKSDLKRGTTPVHLIIASATPVQTKTRVP